MKIPFALFVCFTLSIKLCAQATIPEGYKLVYSQDFESAEAIHDFEMTDSKVWRISKGSKGNCLELIGKSNYKPEVRSPFNIALIKNVLLGDFIYEIRLNQNGREYGHRDLCLMFGITNASNFYYTHIASKADTHANSIFLVNDEPRKSIASERTMGTSWGAVDDWHTARVVRKVEEGVIEIYFDDMTIPIMKATDTHFKSGYLGFGSFDDTGKFDDINIWVPEYDCKFSGEIFKNKCCTLDELIAKKNELELKMNYLLVNDVVTDIEKGSSHMPFSKIDKAIIDKYLYEDERLKALVSKWKSNSKLFEGFKKKHKPKLGRLIKRYVNGKISKEKYVVKHQKHTKKLKEKYPNVYPKLFENYINSLNDMWKKAGRVMIEDYSDKKIIFPTNWIPHSYLKKIKDSTPYKIYQLELMEVNKLIKLRQQKIFRS